jgi:tripartite-type tricarboxylate transporter receptor subunit TctC
LRPVAFVAIDSQGLAVNAAHPARTLPEFLRAAKAKPFTFAGEGERDRGAVPERCAGAQCPARQSRGHTAAPVAELHPQVQQRVARVLAVTGPRRAGALPDIATLDELGLPGLAINGWVGMLAPARTSAEIGARLMPR